MRHLVAAALALTVAACGPALDAPANTYPGVAGHARYLPLLGSPHEPSAGGPMKCESCHASTTFTQFTCTSSACHAQTQTDPIHAGIVQEYQWADAACYRCHPQGIGTFPEHGARFFPIGASTAHDLACTRCHTTFTNRQDTATLACATCHQGLAGFSSAHARVDAYQAEPGQCVRCHADGQVDAISAHAKFPIAHGSASHDTDCLGCHAQLRADKPFGADFTAYDCLRCHAQATTDAAHAGVTGYQYASTVCYGCHKDGTAAPPNHTPDFFPIGATSKHAGIACSQCHADLSRPNDPAAFRCATCHQGLAGWSTAHVVSGYAILTTKSSANASPTPLPTTTPSVYCLRCHADSQVDRVASHPRGEDAFGKAPHLAAGCLTCHTRLRADKPFGTDFGSEGGCVTCHPNGTGGD